MMIFLFPFPTATPNNCNRNNPHRVLSVSELAGLCLEVLFRFHFIDGIVRIHNNYKKIIFFEKHLL